MQMLLDTSFQGTAIVRGLTDSENGWIYGEYSKQYSNTYYFEQYKNI